MARSQAGPAPQALRAVRPADELAPALGPGVGGGALLQRPLSPRGQARATAMTGRVLLILGDQLSPDHPALAALDAA